jgi:(p)ppGpp synthase/HD superfamily hydrolase
MPDNMPDNKPDTSPLTPEQQLAMQTTSKLSEAWLFAAKKHNAQLYPGTDLPYLTHLGSVVLVLWQGLLAKPTARADLALLCAILHDTIEDTQTSPEELSALFGEEVKTGVLALSKDPNLSGQAAMIDSLSRIQKCPSEVWMVKLADRIANLTVPAAHWSADKRRLYAQEGLLIYRELYPASDFLSLMLKKRISAWLDE